MLKNDIKVQENRLRRIAERRGYRLIKTRRRDPLAIDYGIYLLIDLQRNRSPCGSRRLDDIEWFLSMVQG